MVTSNIDLIYNELVLLRQDFAKYVDKMETRVSSLEQWRDKLVGVFIAIGIGIKYSWDVLKERLF